MPPAVQKPSAKALLQWGGKKQNQAISAVLREGQESVITDNTKRAAKSKALDKKVWMGNAPTGSATASSKKRPVPGGKQRSGKTKKTKISVEEADGDDDGTADRTAKHTEELPVVRKRSAKKVIVSEPEDEDDDMNNGRRDAKVTDSAEDSNSDGQSGPDGTEESQKKTDRVPKRSRARRGAKNLHDGSPEREQEESDNGSDKENEANPATVTKAMTNRQIKRQQEIPRWAQSIDTDDEVPAPSKATKKAGRAPAKAAKTTGTQKYKTTTAGNPTKTTTTTTVSDTDATLMSSGKTEQNDVSIEEHANGATMTSDGEFVQDEEFANKPGQLLPYTNLKFNPGKPLSLLVQTPQIQAIIRKAMTLANADLIFIKGFPSDAERQEYSRNAMREAAVILDGKRGHVVLRIDCDVGYVSMLSKIVDSRFSQFRFDLKKVAQPVVLEYYGLKDGPGCAELALALLHQRAFLFPGDVMSASGVDRTKPFGHAVFPVLLGKLFFRKAGDIGIAFKDRFFSSVDDDDALEMSGPMLSFAGVLAEHIIGECITGVHSVKNLSADVSTEHWNGNMSKLRELFEKKLARFHRFMVGLLAQAMKVAEAPEEDSNEIDWDNMSD